MDKKLKDILVALCEAAGVQSSKSNEWRNPKRWLKGENTSKVMGALELIAAAGITPDIIHAISQCKGDNPALATDELKRCRVENELLAEMCARLEMRASAAEQTVVQLSRADAQTTDIDTARNRVRRAVKAGVDAAKKLEKRHGGVSKQNGEPKNA